MAKYNTFVVYDCRRRKNILVTSSARKAKGELCAGIKAEVWNENVHIETVYSSKAKDLDKYIALEKQYIAKKQANAKIRNEQRRRKNCGL